MSAVSTGTIVNGPPQGTPATSGAPGAGAPLSTLGVAKSAVVFLGASVVGLVGLRVLFGGKAELPPMRIDALEVAKVWMAYETFNIPLKLVAYHFHGHSFSQSILLFT